MHREITEGAAPGDFGQLLLRWEALYLWTFGQSLALAGLPTPPATADLNRQLVEALALLADAWVTNKLWVTAYAMWTFADLSFSLTAELDAALTESDDRYQAAVAAWASLADRCQVDGALPASPLPPPA